MQIKNVECKKNLFVKKIFLCFRRLEADPATLKNFFLYWKQPESDAAHCVLSDLPFG